MKLQCDPAVGAEWLRVSIVDHQYSVQSRYVSVTLHLQQVLVPLVLAHDSLVFGCGPDQPLTPDIVDAGCVPPDCAIDLELWTLNEVGSAGLELGVKKH